MKKVKVVVIGNSVGIRVRPPLESPHNLNYSQLLEQLISDLSPDSVGHVENIVAMFRQDPSHHRFSPLPREMHTSRPQC